MMDSATRTYGADPGGLNTEEVLEFALWQAQAAGTHPQMHTIPELDGEYLIYDRPLSDDYTHLKQSMTAIGVQCSSASGAGWARLN